jgi:ABC-type branched-subunit amino acid transport system ATPase component
MSDPFFAVNSVQAGYGDVRVLWDISVSIQRGEIGCIVGSNGAGKTTLLNTISGLVKPTAGSIKLDGVELANAPSDVVLGAGIAHVPEGRRLFKGLSVEDNLMLGAYLRDDLQDIRNDLALLQAKRDIVHGSDATEALADMLKSQNLGHDVPSMVRGVRAFLLMSLLNSRL